MPAGNPPGGGKGIPFGRPPGGGKGMPLGRPPGGGKGIGMPLGRVGGMPRPKGGGGKGCPKPGFVFSMGLDEDWPSAA